MTLLSILLSLMIGSVFGSVGIGLYVATHQPIVRREFPKRSIIWGVNMSETLVSFPSIVNQSVTFLIMSQENDTSVFDCVAQFLFDPVEIPSTLDFTLYFPYQLRNVTAEISMWLKPQLTKAYESPLAVSSFYNNSEDATKVNTKIEAQIAGFRYYIKMNFLWMNAISQLSQLEYRLIVPFSFVVIDLPGSSRFFERFELYAILPKDSVVTSWIPQPTSLLGDPEGRTFYWNLTMIPLSPSVLISFEIQGHRELRETLVFWTGLLTGLGVPIIVSSLIELLRYLVKPTSKRARRKKQTESSARSVEKSHD